MSSSRWAAASACPFFPGKRYEDWKLDDPRARASTLSVRSATTSNAASRNSSPPSSRERRGGQRMSASVLFDLQEGRQIADGRALMRQHAGDAITVYSAGLRRAIR